MFPRNTEKFKITRIMTNVSCLQGTYKSTYLTHLKVTKNREKKTEVQYFTKHKRTQRYKHCN